MFHQRPFQSGAHFRVLLLLSNAHVSDERDWSVVKIFWKSNMVLQRFKNAQFFTILVRQIWSARALRLFSGYYPIPCSVRIRCTRHWPANDSIRPGRDRHSKRDGRQRSRTLRISRRTALYRNFSPLNPSGRQFNMSNTGV